MKPYLILLALVFACYLPVGIQSTTQQQGKTEYLERRVITNIVGEKVFLIEFTDDDLSKTPAWDPEKEAPPIPLPKAIAMSREYLGKFVENSKLWQAESIRYELVGKRKWVYIIDFKSVGNELNTDSIFSLVLKMNGNFVEPKISLQKED